MTHRLLKNWFEDKGWRPFPFQKECWKAYLEGKSGLVHAPTGVGKTYAVLGGPLLEFAQLNHKKVEPLRVLWITPLRALANDTLKSILQPIEELGLNLTAELRHGDVSSHIRKKQLFKLPSLLIITPESLSLLFTYPETRQRFSSLAAVIVDEWHEMLGNKRGVQTELALGRLKKWSPKLKIWGVSATLSNLPESMNVLLGDRARDACIVEGKLDKKVEVQTLMPKDIETFPWAGHLGIRLVDQVIEHIARVKTSILFTNTRAQTELWFEAILKTRPQWKDQIALHHGSIDRDIRKSVELKLKQEQLKVVVSTSSLDLGVDFSPVEKVFQVGSPKGIARLIQRAGRSGHQPGKPSCIIGVPTNALELIEFAAARDAIKQNEIEARAPTIKPLDVLIQHIVTVAAEGKTQIQDLKDEILSSNAYKDLTEDEWEWALNFVTQGGKALSAYPQYTKVVIEPNNVLTVPSKQTVHFHRMSIGTITADSQVLVKFLQGRLLGSVEESFITRIKPGDIFQFAGKRLKLIRFKDLTAYVRLAKSSKKYTPSWQGGRAPLSSELAEAVARKIQQEVTDKEMKKVQPILKVQQKWSRLPGNDILLVEATKLQKQFQVTFFPFAGRLVHEGLAALVAFRLSQRHHLSLKTTANDYGFCIQSNKSISLDELLIRKLLTTENLLDDLLECMNVTELARRQFREIARIAGLVLQGYPGQKKTARQLQVSSSLLFEMFTNYDHENLLLEQAQREILEGQLELTRLMNTLQRLEKLPLHYCQTKRITPLAFPLWAEQLHAQISSESWKERVKQMAESLKSDA